MTRSVVLMIALLSAMAGCGGDSGPTTPDNTPVAIQITPSTAFTVASGGTRVFTVSATARDGHVITAPAINWSSSSPAVAAMSGPQLTAVKVGTSTITATSGSVSASVTVTVTPGAVGQLGIQRQPAGATANAPLATQPVIELQDAAGNLVTSSTAFVTAAIASGGGTLAGTVSVAAVSGVVTFTDLRIIGIAGQRTLSFSAGTLSTTSAPFTVSAPPAPVIVVDSASVSFTAERGSKPASRVLNITNVGAQPLVGMSVDVVYDAGQPSGWLLATLSSGNAPATLTLNIDTAGVVEGTYHANVRINGPGATNSPVSVSVNLTITPSYSVSYGAASQKIRVLDVGANFAPTISILDKAGNPLPAVPLTFTSRASTVATVGSDGRITAVGGGDAWIIAGTAATSDSVFVIVPRSPTTPVLRTDVTSFGTRLGDTLFVNVVFDARSTTVGAAALAVEFSLQAGSLSFFFSAPTSAPAPVVNSPASGIIRISVAAANGMTGNVPVLTLKIVGRTVNTNGWLNLFALDVSDVQGTSLTAQSSSTRLPFVFR